MDHLIQIIYGTLIILVAWLICIVSQWPISWWHNRTRPWVREEFILFLKALGWIVFFVALAWALGYVWLNLL